MPEIIGSCCCGIASCCPQALPTTLIAHFSSTCSCLDGVTVTLTYNAGTGKWSGTYDTSGCSNNGTISLDFLCDSGAGLGGCRDFKLEWTTCGGASGTDYAQSSCTCSPLNVPFASDPGNCCPGGTLTVTITE